MKQSRIFARLSLLSWFYWFFSSDQQVTDCIKRHLSCRPNRIVRYARILRTRVPLQIMQLKVQGSLSLSCVNFEKQQTFLRAMLVLSLIGSFVFFFSELVSFSDACSHRLNGQVSRLINCSCLTTCTVLNGPFMSELLMYFFNSTVGVFSHVCTPKEMSGSAKLLTCLKDGKKLNASWELFDGNFVSNYRRVNTTSQNICVSIIDVRVQPLFLEWSKSNFSCQYHALKKINQSWHL